MLPLYLLVSTAAYFRAIGYTIIDEGRETRQMKKYIKGLEKLQLP